MGSGILMVDQGKCNSALEWCDQSHTMSIQKCWPTIPQHQHADTKHAYQCAHSADLCRGNASIPTSCTGCGFVPPARPASSIQSCLPRDKLVCYLGAYLPLSNISLPFAIRASATSRGVGFFPFAVW